MRHTSRKTIVKAEQFSLWIQEHCRRNRGVGIKPRRVVLKPNAGSSSYLAVAIIIASLLGSSLSADVNAQDAPAVKQSPSAATGNTSIDTERVTKIKPSAKSVTQTAAQAVVQTGVNVNFKAKFKAQVQNQLYPLTLPEQTVAEALNSLSEQTDIQVLFPYDIATEHRIKPLAGSYNLQHALKLLLQDTGLYGGLTDSGVIAISHHGNESRINQNGKGKRMNINSKKSKTLLAAMVGVFAAGGAMGVSAQGQGEAAAAQAKIDEIIVTASKRATSLQDTAMAITALTGETIDKRGLVGMADYLAGVPGVTANDMGAGQNVVVIRGMASDPQIDGSLAGIYFGEAPMANLINFVGVSNGAGDIKMVDIERVEVLRGPQGTLYGSSGMSGVVKIIPTAPNLTEVEGKLATRFSQTGEEGGDNTMVQGVLNVPLIEDTLAVRAVVYQFKNSGYIENVAASQPLPDGPASVGGVAIDRGDVGNDEYTGFRLAALWQPTDQLDMTLSYTTQDIEQDGMPDVNLLLDGKHQQQRYNVGEGGSRYEFLESEVDVVSLVANYDLGWGRLSSTSSQLDVKGYAGFDLTWSNGWLGLPYLPPYGAISTSNYEVFTQELRFASQLDGPLEFVTGVYYEDFDGAAEVDSRWAGSGPLPDDIMSLGSYTGPVPERWFTTSWSTPTTQKAFFGEVVYNFSEQLSVTLGGRHFDYEKERNLTLNNVFSLFEDNVLAKRVINETGQSYKANLSYAMTEDMMVYGQWAEGFRLGRGQPEVIACTLQGIETPDSVESDTSENFELGLKSSFADGRATFNAAVYRINWQGIPVFVAQGGGCGFTANVGEAISEGVELELSAQLSDSFRLDLSASYGEATIDKDARLGGVNVEKGDNLPGSADFNARLGAHYDFTLAGYDSFARLDYTYMSEFYTELDESRSFAPSGGFGQFNIKTGIAFNQFAVDVFVNNLTNEDGITWTDSVNNFLPDPQRANRVRPRTMGVNLSYQF